MQHVIRLGNGRCVSLGEYVRGVHRVRANPDAIYEHGFCGWWPISGREMLREFREGLQDRINQRSGLVIPSKHDEHALRQLAHRINTPSLIVRVSELGRWRKRLLARIPDRFTDRE